MGEIENNYAFIDSQNLNLGVRELGWSLDWNKFRIFLKENYSVTKAFLFLGYMNKYQNLYMKLRSYGFILIFKPTVKDSDGSVKGNCDADLVLYSMIEFKNFDKAVIVSGDGDFYSLVGYFYRASKLEVLLAPNKKRLSGLLKNSANEKLRLIEDSKNKLIYKK